MDVENFVNRLKWRSVFKGQNMPSAPRLLPARKTGVARCPQFMTPGFATWLQHVRGVIWAALRRAACTAKNFKKYNTEPAVVRRGIALLEQLQLVATKNDKEPGFSLEPVQDHVLALETILKSPCYREIGYVKGSLVREDFVRLCYGAARSLGNRDLAKQWMAGGRTRRPSVFSKLLVTKKSHKSPGAIPHRDVHGSSDYLFSGLSVWLGRTIEEELRRRAPHLLRSREAFVEETRQVKLPPLRLGGRWRLVRLDVKDFFMSGSIADIGSLVTQ